MRLLVANDPRAYRDAMAAAFRSLRPEVDVVVAESEALESAIERYQPAMVVCSRLTQAVTSQTPSWVVLYPEGRRLVYIRIADERSTVVDIDLADLALLIDQTSLLVRMGSMMNVDEPPMWHVSSMGAPVAPVRAMVVR